MKSEFSPSNGADLAVAEVVHDLRNQLAITVACADIIRGCDIPEEAVQVLADLRESAQRALRLSRQLLDVDGDTGGGRSRRLSLNDVVTTVAERLSHLTQARIDLRLRLSPEPLRVDADRVDLERIVMNLALNARDAMDRGGILTIRTTMALDPACGRSAEAPPARPVAVLMVADTGCGMTPEVKARVFEPYFTTKDMGMGVGLPSVAATVRRLKGRIAIDTEPGLGTAVSVHIPCAD